MKFLKFLAFSLEALPRLNVNRYQKLNQLFWLTFLLNNFESNSQSSKMTWLDDVLRFEYSSTTKSAAGYFLKIIITGYLEMTAKWHQKSDEYQFNILSKPQKVVNKCRSCMQIVRSYWNVNNNLPCQSAIENQIIPIREVHAVAAKP